MQGLIIAAGQGTRLRGIAPSKPLAEVGGAALIEHVARAAIAGGVSELLVVTGYRPEPLEAFLEDLGKRLAVPVRTVRNPDWPGANGLSVLAAARFLPGEFALLMSDHLFDPEILAGLIEARPAGAALTLAVDRRIGNPQLDLDDATKVELDGERIVRIGKALEGYQAVDTGIFVAAPPLFEALDRALAEGGTGSLSEGVQRLADQGLAAAFDSGSRWWLDVDDEAAFAKAEAALTGQRRVPST
jgi:1L-myo-inositol 1-phosphate cytidylyltransferase